MAAQFAAMLAKAQTEREQWYGRMVVQLQRYLLLVAGQELGDDLRARVAPSDLVQETVLDGYCRFDQFSGNNEEELKAWLTQILHHKAITHARAHRTQKRDVGREVSLEPGGAGRQFVADNGSDTPSERASQQEQVARLLATLETLTPDHASVIRLRDLQQKTFEEIGALMGRSADAVRKLHVRALEALAGEMGETNDATS